MVAVGRKIGPCERGPLRAKPLPPLLPLSVAVSSMRTIILGDVHLGSPLCRTGHLLQVLEQVPFDRLILNGDVFDDLNFRRLLKRHWAILERVRDLSREREVVWIRGNHDGNAAVLGHLLGFEVLAEFVFEFRGRKVYVVHGDEFDDFQKSAKRWRPLRDRFYGFALWFDVPRKTLIQWAQRSSYTFARAIAKVKHRAVEKGRSLGAAYVVAGHTHHREVDIIGGMTYLNPSSWLTPHPAYVLFDDAEDDPEMVLAGDKRLPSARWALGKRVRSVGAQIRRRLR
jgi:UDP-2,3-diacylglucosamine pyrophosphatase LpxH